MTHITNTASAEAVLSACARDPDIRILRRVSSLNDFPCATGAVEPIRRIAIVDTETTGTDVMHEEIIDIAVVTIEVDARGEIVGIVSKGEALRDPGVPIPEAITRLTGITDDDVRGQTIDLDRLERVLARADVRVAHNAAFDIAFVENLMPGLAGAAWACSANDFDWIQAGLDGKKLQHLLMQIGRFSSAHRAMADVVALLYLLAHRLPDGGTVIARLLENAERHSVRFEATGAPFDRRSQLKQRGYRWDPHARVWWIELAERDCLEEERWFLREISPPGPMPRTRPITWHERHR